MLEAATGGGRSLRLPARSKVAAAGDLLRERWGKGHCKMRRDKGKPRDHKVVAGAHRVADAELQTAATLSNSGEGLVAT